MSTTVVFSMISIIAIPVVLLVLIHTLQKRLKKAAAYIEENSPCETGFKYLESAKREAAYHDSSECSKCIILKELNKE